jgi:DAACS family dicarboxylate/amino acid:cation (Na+ or H+) symporter
MEQQDWILKNLARPTGDVFLNLMFLTVIPLIFSSLALGVAGLGNPQSVGRMGGRFLIGTVILSTIAVMIGVGLTMTLQPGSGMDPAVRAALLRTTQGTEVDRRIDQAASSRTMAEVISTTVSRNPLEDAVNLFNPAPHYRGGGIISFLFVSILVGVALLSVAPVHRQPLVVFLEGVQAVSMKIIEFAMVLAPYGVAALVFQASAQIGGGLFSFLGAYVFCVFLGLGLHGIVTYSLILWLGVGRPPWEFFRLSQDVLYTAFSTSSSSATLPTALQTAIHKLRLRRALASFILTVGATSNQNGTALFQAVTLLFLAQFYGIDLVTSALISIVFMSIVAGIGTAGVPGGSLPVIVLLLQGLGIPAGGIGMILGVDRLLDMGRTTINVAGDLVIAEIVAGNCPDGPGRIAPEQPLEEFEISEKLEIPEPKVQSERELDKGMQG